MLLWGLRSFKLLWISSSPHKFFLSVWVILILESLGHIRHIHGNGMGRLTDDIKLVWGHILLNCKLREVDGKKTSCYPLYGRDVRICFQYQSHSNAPCPLSFLSMGITWDIYTVQFHRLSMGYSSTWEVCGDKSAPLLPPMTKRKTNKMSTPCQDMIG